MRPRAGRGVVALLALIAAGCVDLFLPTEPGDDPLAVFDLFWSEIDAYYAYFAYKPELDWHAIRNEYRPRVDPDGTDGELATLLGAMITELRDGHADLDTPYGHFGFDPFAGRPVNHDPALVRDAYLTGQRQLAGGVYETGWVTDAIGYVEVTTMAVEGSGERIDDVLDYLAGAAALIIDVRSNGGGTDDVAEPLAARFYDQRRPYRRVRYRDGPAYDDFAEPRTDYLAPAGRHRFTAPVAVLTGRATFSSAETFVVAMRPLPHVVTVGDTTGGGAGNPIFRELPNGWTYRVPRWVVWTHDDLQYEGVGIPPDIPVGDVEPELAAGRDPVLERAIAALEERLVPTT